MTLIREHDGCAKTYSEGLRKKTVQAVEKRGMSKGDAARTLRHGRWGQGTWEHANMGVRTSKGAGGL